MGITWCQQRYYGRGGSGGGGHGGGGGGGGGRGVGGVSHSSGMAGNFDARPEDGQPPSSNSVWAQQGYPVQGPNGWTQ